MKFLFIMHMIFIKSFSSLPQNERSAQNKCEKMLLRLINEKQKALQIKLKIQQHINDFTKKRNEIFQTNKCSLPSDFHEKNDENNIIKFYENLIEESESQLEEINACIISFDQKIEEVEGLIDNIM